MMGIRGVRGGSPFLQELVETANYCRILIAFSGLKLKDSPYRFGFQGHVSLTLSFEDGDGDCPRSSVRAKDRTDGRTDDFVLGDYCTETLG